MYHKITFDAEDHPPSSYYLGTANTAKDTDTDTKGDKDNVKEEKQTGDTKPEEDTAGTEVKLRKSKSPTSGWWKDPNGLSAMDLDKIPEFKPRPKSMFVEGTSANRVLPCHPMFSSGIPPPQTHHNAVHYCSSPSRPPTAIHPGFYRTPLTIPFPGHPVPMVHHHPQAHTMAAPFPLPAAPPQPRPVVSTPGTPGLGPVFLPGLNSMQALDMLRARNAHFIGQQQQQQQQQQLLLQNHNMPATTPGTIPPGYTANITHLPRPGGGPPVPAILIKKKRKKKSRGKKKEAVDQDAHLIEDPHTDQKASSPFASSLTSERSEDAKHNDSDSDPDVDHDRRSEPDLMKMQKGSMAGRDLEDLDLIQTAAGCALVPTASCPDLTDAQKQHIHQFCNGIRDSSEEAEMNNPVVDSAVRALVRQDKGGIQSESVRALDREVARQMHLEHTLVPKDDPRSGEPLDDDDELFNRLLIDCLPKDRTTAPMSLQDEIEENSYFESQRQPPTAATQPGNSFNNVPNNKTKVLMRDAYTAQDWPLRTRFAQSAVVFEGRDGPSTRIVKTDDQQQVPELEAIPRRQKSRALGETWKRFSTTSDSFLLTAPKAACCNVM